MTQRIRHRWTVVGAPAFGQLEPHELAVDHGQRQLYTSETGSGREAVLPVTFYDERAGYAADDIVAHDGLLWVANKDIAAPAGAFNTANWFKMNEADVGTAIDDAMAAHVAEEDPHTQYATDADMGAHITAPDPHPQYATDADLAAHAGAVDPHPQYATDADVAGAVPPGSMMIWPGAAAPAGWAMCQGQAFNRAANPKLFTAIGTMYGAGDGSATANLPDMRGLFPRGLDAGRGVDPGRALGTSQTSAFASHGHGVNDPQHNHGVNDPAHAHSVADPGHLHGAWTDVQGDHAHTGGEFQGTNAVRNEAWANYHARIAGQGANNTGVGGAHGHNVGVAAALTGIAIYGATTGISIQARGTGISIQANGAAETRPINLALNYIIRLG